MAEETLSEEGKKLVEECIHKQYHILNQLEIIDSHKKCDTESEAIDYANAMSEVVEFVNDNIAFWKQIIREGA